MPTSNVVVKRVNHLILEWIRAMMHQAGADKFLWAEAFLTFVVIKNRSPHTALNGKGMANLKLMLHDCAIPHIFVSYEGDTNVRISSSLRTATPIVPDLPVTLANDGPIQLTVNCTDTAPVVYPLTPGPAPPTTPAVPHRHLSRPTPSTSSPMSGMPRSLCKLSHSRWLYMCVPDGVNGLEWNAKVLKLDRALYGLKQVGHTWNAKIHPTLKRISAMPRAS
ncbi:hypothetical protein JCM21900_004550 [Sporobolomyces salmonicolor]